MQKFREQIREFFAAAGIKKGNIPRFVVALAIPTIFFLAYMLIDMYFFQAIWVVNGILLGAVLLIVAAIAGFAVVKSLFLVAGELSLLIFLSQSYCQIPFRGAANDEALKNLLALGLLYIGITFVRSVREISKENYKKVKNRQQWPVTQVITLALSVILTGLFLWQVYLVVGPIIANLCVYR